MRTGDPVGDGAEQSLIGGAVAKASARQVGTAAAFALESMAFGAMRVKDVGAELDIVRRGSMRRNLGRLRRQIACQRKEYEHCKR